MKAQQSIEEIFFKYLTQYQFDEAYLDYSVLDKHICTLQTISTISSSGASIFDVCKRQMLYFSPNFGNLLGYNPADYQDIGQLFFAHKIHPDDAVLCSLNGVTSFKLFHNFSSDAKLNHKLLSEYRMLNAQNQYVRIMEQYQVLELDNKGQLWLLLNIMDISPNQDLAEGVKNQLINFRTGQILPLEMPNKAQFELTKRELEILKLVKEGYLSKEISNKLSISLHTVNTHRQRFLEKLGANNSMEAILFASKFGLLE